MRLAYEKGRESEAREWPHVAIGKSMLVQDAFACGDALLQRLIGTGPYGACCPLDSPGQISLLIKLKLTKCASISGRP
jgi:hypothetical protein